MLFVLYSDDEREDMKEMQVEGSTAAIILAAGSSSRMGEGRHKLLLPLDERPVVMHVVEAALTSRARPVIVVLGHQAGQVRKQVERYGTDRGIIFVENRGYLEGMSTSMRVGVECLQNLMNNGGMQVDSAMILLGDQPMVTGKMLDRLIEMWHRTGKPVVIPLYEGKRGNPALFAASLFGELVQVTGDEGGRSVVVRHREEMTPVEMGDVMANYDVDTWDAYQKMVELWQKRMVE